MKLLAKIICQTLAVALLSLIWGIDVTAIPVWRFVLGWLVAVLILSVAEDVAKGA